MKNKMGTLTIKNQENRAYILITYSAHTKIFIQPHLIKVDI